MTKEIKDILARLDDYEKRLAHLEGKAITPVAVLKAKVGKQKTLREMVKGKKFKNGQEQIAIIVGYHEKILGNLLSKDKIKEEWTNAKIINKFSAEFLSRARDVLVRVHSDGTCDLTQGGEDFFDSFLKG